MQRVRVAVCVGGCVSAGADRAQVVVRARAARATRLPGMARYSAAIAEGRFDASGERNGGRVLKWPCRTCHIGRPRVLRGRVLHQLGADQREPESAPGRNGFGNADSSLQPVGSAVDQPRLAVVVDRRLPPGLPGRDCVWCGDGGGMWCSCVVARGGPESAEADSGGGMPARGSAPGGAAGDGFCALSLAVAVSLIVMAAAMRFGYAIAASTGRSSIGSDRASDRSRGWERRLGYRSGRETIWRGGRYDGTGSGTHWGSDLPGLVGHGRPAAVPGAGAVALTGQMSTYPSILGLGWAYFWPGLWRRPGSAAVPLFILS